MLDIYFKVFGKCNDLGVRNITEKRQSGKILNRVSKKDTGRDYSWRRAGGRGTGRYLERVDIYNIANSSLACQNIHMYHTLI